MQPLVARTAAVLLVGVFMLSGLAVAQNTLVPSLPIQDTVGNCFPVRDRPLSFTDTQGLTGPGPFRPNDFDADGPTNAEELSQGSDPTWKKSTPNDKDADGVNATATPGHPADPCDYDPSVPNVRLVLNVTCIDCAPGGVIERLNTLELSLEIRDGSGAPRNAEGDTATCRIDFQGDGAPADRVLTLGTTDRHGEDGNYTRGVTIAIGDWSGTWAFRCSANVGQLARESNEAKVVVNPTEFPVTITLDLVKYFEDDVIHVTAKPTAGFYHIPAGQTGEALLHAETANGVPITPVDGQPMVWNEAERAWKADLNTDRFPDGGSAGALLDAIEKGAFDGIWSLRVEATDAASAPNSGEGTKTVEVTSDLVDQLVLTGPATAARKGQLHYAANYKFRGTPASESVYLTVQKDGVKLVDNQPMASASTGAYTYDVAFPIGSDSGKWSAQARLVRTGGVEVKSNLANTTVDPAFVTVVVSTDKASYVGSGARATAPNPSPQPIISGAQSGVIGPVATWSPDPNTPPVLNPTPAADAAGDAIDGATGSAAPSQGEEILVLAYPAGTQGTDFFNDAPASAPGTATFTLEFSGVVDSPTATDIEMQWVGPGHGIPFAHFLGTYRLGATDLPGSWRAKVHYEDDANEPNAGDGSQGFQVLNPTKAPLPPAVSITSINGVVVAQGQSIPVDQEAWIVAGEYSERNAPAQPTDANEVWVRINAGTKVWLPAQLSPGAPGKGTWSVTLHSQRTYGLNALSNGALDVQAVAVVNPILAAGSSCAGNNAAACNQLSPNGNVGSAVVAQGLENKVIYSTTASARAQFTFPNTPRAVLLGVIGANGQLVGNGDVLWDAATHTLRGRIDKNGVNLASAKIFIQRVAYDNCATNQNPTATGGAVADPGSEWCRRDNVTTYVRNGQTIQGFDLLSPPSGLEARVLDLGNQPNALYFNWTWNIADSATGPDLGSCNGSNPRDDSYLVEDAQSLVRRTNHRRNGTSGEPVGAMARYPQAGGTTTCHVMPERLEAQSFLPPWALSAAHPAKNAAKGLAGAPDMVESARYWVWMDLATDKGFSFDQTKPRTRDDVKEAHGDLTAQATQADSPTLAQITAAGVIPTFDAVQLRFGAYPRAALTQIKTVTAQGDDVTAAPGDALFQLRNASAPIEFQGTVLNNGNPTIATSLKLVLYKVSFEDCASDTVTESTADDYLPDTDGEWCVKDVRSFPIAPSDFIGSNYQTGPQAGLQSFKLTVNPAEAGFSFTEGSMWWATVSLQTADGDRVEFLPPMVDARAAAGTYKNPGATAMDPQTFNYFFTFEHTCKSPACAPASISAPYLENQPGRLGNATFAPEYTGVGFMTERPVLDVRGIGPLIPVRFDDPNAARGATCMWSNVSPNPCGATLFGKGIIGAVAGDDLVIRGSSTDFAFLNDLTQVTATYQTLAFNLNGANEAATKTVLQTVSVPVSLAIQHQNATESVSRNTTQVSGHTYLREANWTIHLDTRGLLETIGPKGDFLTRLMGITRAQARGELTITLRSASGYTSSLTVALHMDRLDAPTTTLLESTRTTTDLATFLPATTQVPATGLDKVNNDPQYLKISGNHVLRFETSDRNGLDLGNAAPNAQKLTGVEIATSREAPEMQFMIFARNAEDPLQPLGLPGSIPVDAPVPLVICPKSPQTPDQCDYDDAMSTPGSAPTIPTGGSEFQGVTFYLVPLRVGLDPPFMKVDNPNDPATWQPDPGDTTFRADLSTGGTFVDQRGRGYFMDTPNGKDAENSSFIDFLYVGLMGNVDPSNPQAAESVTGKGSVQNQAAQATTAPWAEAGMDEPCQAGMDRVLAGDAEGAQDCVYDPYLPFNPTNSNPSEWVEWCTETVTPNTQQLQRCFEANDDWGACFLQDPTGDKREGNCDGSAGQPDETRVESWYLINRNLPFWIQVRDQPPAATCAPVTPADTFCNDSWDWQRPSDPNEPDPASGNYTIPRGFIWARYDHPQNFTTRPDLKAVNYNVNAFEHVFVTLDPTSPDYGKLVLPDGNYTVSIRGTDNTESWSSVLDPQGTPNDANRVVDFKFWVENDADDDGVSDLREAWLQARIQKSDALPANVLDMCQDPAYDNCFSDRYYDADTQLPDASVASSTEDDWDADGIPNHLVRHVDLPTVPQLGDVGEAPGIDLIFDVELLLNADPLDDDFPGEPGNCVNGAKGKGLLGDRNGDCVPNGLDVFDNSISRCNPPDADADDDGYCDSFELQRGSNPNDHDSTPGDKDGDGQPNLVNDVEDFVFGTLDDKGPSGVCVQVNGFQCPHGHLVSVDIDQGGVGHVYVDASAAGSPSFSVGFSYAGSKPAACNEVKPGHCEIVGTSTLASAQQTVLDLLNGRLCVAGLPPPLVGSCPHGHVVSVEVGQGGVGHLFVNRTGTNFSVGYSYTTDAKPAACPNEVSAKHCELVGTDSFGDAVATLVSLVNGEICVAGAPAPLLTACEGHLMTVTVNQGGIKHLFVDASAPAATFSVGYHRSSPQTTCLNPVPNKQDDCEILGTRSLDAAKKTALDLVNSRMCVRGVTNATCRDNHFLVATAALSASGTTIDYVYADQAGTAFSVGFHYSGTKPAYCLKEVSPGTCEVAGSTTPSDLNDFDKDSKTNVEELQAGSNPFYKYSKPDDKGRGFPTDWDADSIDNQNELSHSPPSNPFQRCSDWNHPNGWSTSNLSKSCEDTNAVGGV